MAYIYVVTVEDRIKITDFYKPSEVGDLNFIHTDQKLMSNLIEYEDTKPIKENMTCVIRIDIESR